MTIIKDFFADKLHVMVFDTREDMGRMAGEQAAARIRELLAEKEEINIIFAAAPSQNETLETLVSAEGIDWTRVNAFHMDEYVGLDAAHPAGFRNYLKRTVFDRLPLGSVNLINGNAEDPEEEARRYGQLLAAHPADICLLGVGENGHLAFNDPPVADFNDPVFAKVVKLEEKCRLQQVHDGCFEEIGQVEREDFPTEEEQFQIYKTVVQTMAGKRVIIRTLDIGADKQCEYFHMDKEDNPAMGCRAIRICLTRPEIFKTQLRALFRASAFGKLAIMYPMITSVKEVRAVKQIVSEVKEELDRQGIEYNTPEQGIMIETPAAVMISDELAKEVDFFSIGTNDLTQYTLAIDRQNTKLEAFYDAHHPAVLKMIEMTIANAHKAGIWVGICGELGADTKLTKEFLAMGVDELSVSPAKILPVRKVILETDVEAYRRRKQE